MKSKLICLALALLLVLTPLVSCGRRTPPPALEDIYDEVVALIEASYAVNDVIFGSGLPVYEIGSEYAEQNRLYSDNDFANYEYVTERSPYRSVGEIKQALEQVYSTDYLDSIYTGLFDGFVTDVGVAHAQFYETADHLYQRADYEPLVTWQRVYDYSTMRIVKPSGGEFVTLEIDSHLENETTTLTVTLTLVLEENGWRLDTPTY